MTDQRAIDQLIYMNDRLQAIEKKVNEMNLYMKSIAESLRIIAEWRLTLRVNART